eukprot:SAG11_NODE_1712_length_4400_cov_23.295048_1_plen_109_part_00
MGAPQGYRIIDIELLSNWMERNLTSRAWVQQRYPETLEEFCDHLVAQDKKFRDVRDHCRTFTKSINRKKATVTKMKAPTIEIKSEAMVEHRPLYMNIYRDFCYYYFIY